MKLGMMMILAACLVQVACASAPPGPDVPTLDASSIEALNVSLKELTEGMPRSEQERIGMTVAFMIGALVCDPDERPLSEEEMKAAIEGELDELDGLTLEQIRAWQPDSAEKERATSCVSAH